VFLPPDHFVICDRVSSTKPEYHKRWLLHTAAEPVVSPHGFHADHWGGRLFCKTLCPEDAELVKIGGPGKQFWSDGRNWPLPELTPEDWNYQSMGWLDNNHALFGQWRVEVSPVTPAMDDVFLHFLQAGDTSLQSMDPSTLIRTEAGVGIRFSHGRKECEVVFSLQDEAAGRILITENGQKVLEENLTASIKHQEGL
jgi:heparin/heparan-sulfate lyase